MNQTEQIPTKGEVPTPQAHPYIKWVTWVVVLLLVAIIVSLIQIYLVTQNTANTVETTVPVLEVTTEQATTTPEITVSQMESIMAQLKAASTKEGSVGISREEMDEAFVQVQLQPSTTTEASAEITQKDMQTIMEQLANAPVGETE